VGEVVLLDLEDVLGGLEGFLDSCVVLGGELGALGEAVLEVVEFLLEILCCVICFF